MKRAFLLGSLVLGLVAGPAAAAPAKQRVYRFVGTSCTESWVLFFLDEPTLRRHLPARFKVKFVAGDRGELMVTITKCESARLDGKSIGATITSEIGIYVEPPPERPRLGDVPVNWDYYQLWQVTNSPALSKALGAIGVYGGAVPAATFTPMTPAYTEANVPWQRVAYQINVGVPVPDSFFGARPSAFWHLSRKGLAATHYAAQNLAYWSGDGVLRTSSGPIADMVGGTTVVAHAAAQAEYKSLTATMRLLGK